MSTTSVFARALAGAESQEQADFFNEFCSSMMGICKGREGSQLWYIGEKLDESAAKMLKELADADPLGRGGGPRRDRGEV